MNGSAIATVWMVWGALPKFGLFAPMRNVFNLVKKKIAFSFLGETCEIKWLPITVTLCTCTLIILLNWNQPTVNEMVSTEHLKP